MCSHYALISLLVSYFFSLLLWLIIAFVTEILPDALKTGCKKCTDVQRRQGRKVLDFLVKNKPQQFKELEAQYDPGHAYRTKYANELKAEGIVLPD